VVYTRTPPPDERRPPGRLTADDVAPHIRPDATVFVCGSARFAEGATTVLTALGVPAERVRVERFGPTG
jgi:ferredoxin-NADP reductase